MKEVALELLKILQEHTDREHLLSKERLIQLHYEEYRKVNEESLQAKSFYRKIDELTEAGFPVKRTKGKYTKYYIDDVRFSQTELLYLVSMIRSSPDLSDIEADDLIKKLLSMRVHKKAAAFIKARDLPVKRNNAPTDQIEKFGIILEAARTAGKISCKFILSREEKKFSEMRTVSPRAIEFSQEGALVTLLDEGITKRYPLVDIINVEPIEKIPKNKKLF